MFSQNMIDDDEMAIKEGPQYLLFFLKSHLFAFRAEQISEIVELPDITKVPWMQACIKGVCNIRGSVVGVIDIAKYLMDIDYLSSQKSSLVIITISHEGVSDRIGIIVDEVFEVEVFESEEFQDIPKFGLPVHSKYVEAMVRYRDHFIPILSLDAIVDIEALSKRADDDK